MQNFLLKKCPLFQGINPDNINALLSCLSAKKKVFAKDNYIFSEGDEIRDIGILLSGSAQIVKDDFWGNRVIISLLSAGDLFGEAFASSASTAAVSVAANEKCEILFIDFNKITTTCTSVCSFHSQLIKNMLKILADKNINLTDKIEFITRKTTREKALSYFSSVAKKQGGNAIIIPFDRQGLADYLSVERSALSHELGLMKKEGLIDFHKNSFTLKK